LKAKPAIRQLKEKKERKVFAERGRRKRDLQELRKLKRRGMPPKKSNQDISESLPGPKRKGHACSRMLTPWPWKKGGKEKKS